MGPDTLSDRPSPRGGGPADVINVTLPSARALAVTRAKELIAEASGDIYEADEMNRWIGRAMATLEELIRDA